MRQSTSRFAPGQARLVLRPVPGSPYLFIRNRRIHHIWAYAETSADQGLWPQPTTADAAARVVRDIFDDARERVEEMVPAIRILSQ
jgi:hypothetical protein